MAPDADEAEPGQGEVQEAVRGKAQLLQEVLASNPIAGWPERAAAVHEGYDAVHPPKSEVEVTPEEVES